MNYHERSAKNFVQCYEEMVRAYRTFKLNQDYARTFLARARPLLTDEEYAIIRARLSMDITTKPMSMARIAEMLEANGVKSKTVSRQRIEQIIKKTLDKLKDIYGED